MLNQCPIQNELDYFKQKIEDLKTLTALLVQNCNLANNEPENIECAFQYVANELQFLNNSFNRLQQHAGVAVQAMECPPTKPANASQNHALSATDCNVPAFQVCTACGIADPIIDNAMQKLSIALEIISAFPTVTMNLIDTMGDQKLLENTLHLLAEAEKIVWAHTEQKRQDLTYLLQGGK